MTPIEKAARQPIAELIPYLGYGEKDYNKDLKNMNTFGHNNYTFIAQYFDDLWNSGYKFYNTRKNGPSGEWCDMTVDFAMCMAFGNENARKVLYQPMESCGAGCSWSASYYRENGAWSSYPGVGYQIFFGSRGNESHTGLVEKFDDTYVYTIEGNTSDKLMRRQYKRTDSKIAGYGIPNYALVAYLFVDEDTPIHDDEDNNMTEEATKKLINDMIYAHRLTLKDVMDITKDKWIEKFTDLPPWAVDETRELIEMGAIKGVKQGETVEETVIDASLNTYIRPCIVALRVAKKMIGDGPREAVADLLKKMVEKIYDVE